jgi:hypothetical protein
MALGHGTSDQARQAVLSHIEYCNAQDRDRWLALFPEDVVYEDPPGKVVSRGRQVMSEHAWDKAFAADKRWILEAVLVIACGQETQVHIRNHNSVAGRRAWLDSIELWSVNDEGLVDSVRAFWEPLPEQHLEEHLAASRWIGQASG